MTNEAQPETNRRPGARERILLTAHDLFYREGIRATGVDRLIAAAGVTKVTFYRHFPSKDDLVRTFLAYRHERWMGWFKDALARWRAAQSPPEREEAPLAPVAFALAEWLQAPGFRGCAFINTVAELGGALPDAIAIAAAHKQDMARAICELLPRRDDAMSLAEAAALAVDGAIVRAQTEGPEAPIALEGLTRLLAAVTRSAP